MNGNTESTECKSEWAGKCQSASVKAAVRVWETGRRPVHNSAAAWGRTVSLHLNVHSILHSFKRAQTWRIITYGFVAKKSTANGAAAMMCCAWARQGEFFGGFWRILASALLLFLKVKISLLAYKEDFCGFSHYFLVDTYFGILVNFSVRSFSFLVYWGIY